jgi:hypothetical protein
MALEISSNRHALHDASRVYSNLSLAIRPHVFKAAHTASEIPMIPRPEIFEQLSSKPQNTLSPIPIPEPSECAAHLKLLHALYTLRSSVLSSKSLDDAFDIKPKIRTVWRGYRPRRYEVKINDSTFARRREAKWPMYVKFAVLRFLHWVKRADSAICRGEVRGEKVEIGLPPLGKYYSTSRKARGETNLKHIDILMVWHSCLLNPKDFELFCKQRNYRHIRKIEFPWENIVS